MAKFHTENIHAAKILFGKNCHNEMTCSEPFRTQITYNQYYIFILDHKKLAKHIDSANTLKLDIINSLLGINLTIYIHVKVYKK